MRILHIGKYYPPATGGMERFLGDLADAQRAAGHDVMVLVHAHKRSAGERDPPWIRRVPVLMRLIFTPISPTFALWLRRAIRDFRPDVIHMHMPNVSAFWALMLPSALRVPWVVHWQSDVEQSKLSLRLAYPAYRVFEHAVLERAEAIIATSTQYLEASTPLAPWKQKCHVIPLGVAPSRLPQMRGVPSDDLWSSDDGLRVLAVGRLTYYKGFETLVKAVAGAPRMQLVIVGEGEERARLEKLIVESRARGSVRLAGEVDEPTLHRLMASCDVFCLPSLERTESFGIVLVEAMRYSKPLVVSKLQGTGVNWVARDGQNAMLVPPDRPDAWREALQALAATPARRTVLGHLGYQRYLRDFDIGAVERRIRDVYALAMRGAAHELSRPLEPIAGEAQAFDASGTFQASDGSGRLLVVIPALNEAACIGTVIQQARAHSGIDVLVVDDGSTDDTAAVAMLSGAGVVRAPLWQGAWGAIQTGIRYAMRHGYSAVVTMDADGQHEPGYLPQLIEAARDADVVIASCPSRGSRMRHIAWSYFRLLTGFDLDDLTSGFRYYNEQACCLLAAEEATLLDYQDIGVLLLLHHARLRIAEISVAMHPRKHGASRVFSSWWTVARYMAETSLLCLARWNQPARNRLRRAALDR